MIKLKKILSVFIISVLVVTGTVGIVPINSYAEGETVTYAYIEGTDVNVRVSPSKSSASIDKLSHTSATVLKSVKNSEGTWYNL